MPQIDYTPPEDEQGQEWPPAEALAAIVMMYGGDAYSDLNGKIFEVSAYLPEHGYFEIHSIQVVGGVQSLGESLFALADELQPLNSATQKYIKAVTEAQAEIYDEDVYGLRDELDKIGVAVKAESISAWDGAQRQRVRVYTQHVLKHNSLEIPLTLPIPKELF